MKFKSRFRTIIKIVNKSHGHWFNSNKLSTITSSKFRAIIITLILIIMAKICKTWTIKLSNKDIKDFIIMLILINPIKLGNPTNNRFNNNKAITIICIITTATTILINLIFNNEFNFWFLI